MKKLKENLAVGKWDKWKEVEGSLEISRVFQIEDVSERENLLKIRQMLTEEGFDPDSFYVHEYPIYGVYICCQDNQKNYFTVEDDGKSDSLIPTYTTVKCDENRNNCFSCETIKDSIRLMEC